MAKSFFSSSPQKRILCIYSIPDKWYFFKYAIVVVFLSIRRFVGWWSGKSKLKPGYGAPSHDSQEEMDTKQPLSKDPKAFDAVYFNGSNRIGWHVIAALAHRPLNVDGFLIIKVPGVGLLLSSKLPDTVLTHEDMEGNSFSAEGLKLTPLQPMKSWQIQFNGEMRLSHNPNKKIHVILDATWKSGYGIFNYDTDILTKNVAKAMSSEVWTRQYFKRLKQYHQTHYEQFGALTGNIVIDNVDFNINVSTMRDHSFGFKREWKAFHRYVMHIFTLADGRRGNTGIICIPSIFSRMEIGYVCEKDGSMNAVYNVDFDLYQHGENGVPPTNYGFRFMAGNDCYEVKVQVEQSTELFLGLDWEARIVESMCRYTMNGVEGWGVVEWMYSYVGGRHQRL